MRFIHWAHKRPTRPLSAGVNVVTQSYPGLWVVPCEVDPRMANGDRGLASIPEAVWTSRPFGVEIEADETVAVFYRRGHPFTTRQSNWRPYCLDDDNGVVLPVGTPYRVVRTWEASWEGNVLEVTPASWACPDGGVAEAELHLESAEEACEVLDRLTALGGCRPANIFLHFQEDVELIKELYGV